MFNLFVGDTHGRFDKLNQLIAQHKPDNVFVCGDFGYWNEQTFGGPDYNLWDRIVTNDTKVYFCDGNHEDFNMLDKLVEQHGYRKPILVAKNVYYCPRGSELILEDGTSVLFFGGAYSVDKPLRIKDINWFEQEQATFEQLDRVQNKQYDIVVSHTCPMRCLFDVSMKTGINRAKINHTQTEQVLDKLFDIVQPKLWFFGHWHQYGNFEYNGCKLVMLNICAHDRNGCVYEMDGGV